MEEEFVNYMDDPGKKKEIIEDWDEEDEDYDDDWDEDWDDDNDEFFGRYNDGDFEEN